MDEHQMKDAALRLALEGFENIRHHFDTDEYAYEVAVKSITAIKQALAQPEPVIDKSAAIRIATSLGWEPKREQWTDEMAKVPDHVWGKRKPLTDEEIDALPFPPSGTATLRDFVRIIEVAHGITGVTHEQV